MKAKDFKVGQTVWLIKTERVKITESIPAPAKVTKVGNKYVTVDWFRPVQFYDRGCGEDYFVEKTVYSPSAFLFDTKEHAQEFVERRILERDLRAAFDYGNLAKLSIEQLREVKRILSGGSV